MVDGKDEKTYIYVRYNSLRHQKSKKQNKTID